MKLKFNTIPLGKHLVKWINKFLATSASFTFERSVATHSINFTLCWMLFGFTHEKSLLLVAVAATASSLLSSSASASTASLSFLIDIFVFAKSRFSCKFPFSVQHKIFKTSTSIVQPSQWLKLTTKMLLLSLRLILLMHVFICIRSFYFSLDRPFLLDFCFFCHLCRFSERPTLPIMNKIWSNRMKL